MQVGKRRLSISKDANYNTRCNHIFRKSEPQLNNNNNNHTTTITTTTATNNNNNNKIVHTTTINLSCKEFTFKT